MKHKLLGSFGTFLLVAVLSGCHFNPSGERFCETTGGTPIYTLDIQPSKIKFECVYK